MKKSRFRIFKTKWFIVVVILLIVIAVIAYETTKPKKPNFQYTTASIGNVVERVSVTGTVSPVSTANLAFEKGGVISKIYVKVGDSIKSGDPIVSLDSATDKAALDSAQATLADMSSGLTQQQYIAYKSAVDTASTTLMNASLDAVNALHTGYIQAEGAVVNYADSFFTNPQTVNPILNVTAQSSIISLAINNERLEIGTMLKDWQNDAGTADVANISGLIPNADKYLTTIKNFLIDLSVIVNALSPGNSGMPQSAIDSAVATMNTSMSTLNQAVGTITAAETELKSASSGLAQAENTFALQQSGSTPDAVAAQAAKVAQARAVLLEDTIISPIDGIVTQEVPNVGEYIAPGQSGFAVQNDGFKVEAYVAEADIAKVSIGDIASSTLDAYGAYVDFPEKVMMIDPAETVLEGVPTYKVTLQFISPDSRIKSGMTSNIEILTHEVQNVLEVPYRAILVTSTSTSARVVSADGRSYSTVPITTGLKGSDGTIEIISGLKEGDKVVTYVGP